MQCGIVGLPNVGKSTLFNALTATMNAESANYPFCTIEPNIGKVAVPDARLGALAAIAGSINIIPTQIEFVDIAGLVKGASKGEGLGNQFLSHIREVDAIVHVLRCFHDDDVTHVEGRIDPVSDAEIIETELVLADLESVEKRIKGLDKKIRMNDKIAIEQKAHFDIVLPLLEQGIPARFAKIEPKALKNLQLLSAKPLIYIANVAEDEAISGNEYTRQLQEKFKEQIIIISSKIEAEIANLQTIDEKQEFLESIGLTETGLSQIITSSYKLLNLATFFTIGPKEARAWQVLKNATAREAAGVIHTDFEKGFIRAETISYDDYVKYQGEAGARDAGRFRLEGKEYIVNDGDVFHFRFNL